MKEFTLKPVIGKRFVGRKEILKRMVDSLKNVKSTEGFCLYGRRRVGKTSILKELTRKLEKEKNVVVAYLSLYDLPVISYELLAKKISEAVIEAFRKKGKLPLEYSVKTLIESSGKVLEKNIKGLKIGSEVAGEIRFFVELGKHHIKSDAGHVKKAFNLGDKLAEETKTKFVLMLDEFPEILRLENGIQLIKMLRTASEDHKHLALIVSGSIQKTVEVVALSEASPFYKQLVPLKIKPFDEREIEEFLVEYGITYKKDIIKKILEITGGIPFYMQYLGKSIGIKDIEGSADKFIEEEGNIFFKEEFTKLLEKERVIVIALANGITTPTGIARQTNQPVTSITVYLKRLEEKEIIVKISRGIYKLVDPLFVKWVNYLIKGEAS